MATRSKIINIVEANTIISQCVSRSDFKIVDIQETSISNASGGFMSDYIRLEIRIRFSNGNEKSYHFFSKTVPRSSGTHREFVLEVECYVKETGFFNSMIPLLQKYDKQKSRRNEKIVKGKWAPYCFFSREDIIVMEDLSEIGFKTVNSRELFNWDLCVSVMKTLASFHAASVIFEEKEKLQGVKNWRIIEQHSHLLTNVLSRHLSGQEERGWFQAGQRALIALVPLLTKYQHSKNLQKFIQDNIRKACDSTKTITTSNEFRNVVCHGDLWSSNIMFRFGTDGRPEMSRFVDFQLIRYAPPATDIVIFMYTTTNKSFRERHKEALLSVYYDEFVAELHSQGLSAEALFPKKELEKSIEFFSPVGRTIAALYYQMTNMDVDQRSSVFTSAEKFSAFFMDSREKEVCEFFLKDEVYRYRLEEACNELIDVDILQNKEDADSVK